MEGCKCLLSQQQFQLDLHLGSKKAQPKEWPGVPSPAFQFVKDHSLPSVQLQLKLIKLYRSIFAFEVLNHSPTSQYLHSSVHHTGPQSNTSAAHSQCPLVSRRWSCSPLEILKMVKMIKLIKMIMIKIVKISRPSSREDARWPPRETQNASASSKVFTSLFKR